MKRYDVAIVGAGPAGSALAVGLASAGCAVALLDRGRFPRDKVCGDLVSARGLGLLDELGCLDALLDARRVPIRTARVYVDGQPFSEGRMPTLPGLPSHGLTIPRTLLDEVIFRRAQSAGADTFEDCKVSGFSRQRDGVVIEGQKGGEPLRVVATMIVGADGANSVVAKCAGLEMNDARHVLPAMRAYVEGLSLDHAVLCFEQDYFPGYAWIFPIDAGSCNIGVGMVQETLLRHGLGLKAFHHRLERFVERLGREQGANVHIRKSAGWVIKAYVPGRRNHFDRGLLIGEAGCFVDPMTGEGIPLALATAQIARETILKAFQRSRFDAAALSAYSERCRAELDADLRIADLVVSAARNRDLLGLWMRILKVMAQTASRDEDYMLTLGGIMAGLVPARAGLAPEVIVKSLLHPPGFWLKLWEIGRERPLTDLVAGLANLSHWQASTMWSLARDPAWSARWAGELVRKQLGVAAALGGAGLGSGRRFKSSFFSDAGVSGRSGTAA